MIDHRANEIAIVDSLKAYLRTDVRPCEVVRANQVAEAPPHPYVSYTVTTPAAEHSGTYSEAEDGTLYRDILQTWSFTVQSDDAEESVGLAMQVYDYFSAAGHTYLADHGITVRRVGGINARDNLLTIEYEHRNGLDIVLGLLSTIKPAAQPYRDTIETKTFNQE